jgi:hypothetical protein
VKELDFGGEKEKKVCVKKVKIKKKKFLLACVKFFRRSNAITLIVVVKHSLNEEEREREIERIKKLVRKKEEKEEKT